MGDENGLIVGRQWWFTTAQNWTAPAYCNVVFRHPLHLQITYRGSMVEVARPRAFMLLGVSKKNV
jgi:hypothetical protein